MNNEKRMLIQEYHEKKQNRANNYANKLINRVNLTLVQKKANKAANVQRTNTMQVA